MFKKTSTTTLILLSLCQMGWSQGLTEDTLAIEEVVITGSKVEVSRKNIPFSVSLVSREELGQTTESALLPVLSEQIPGLFVTERGVTGFGVAGGAAGQINMRGLGGNPTTQVLILIDGHPQFMGLMGHHLPDAYVTSDAERIEVIRGPGSILYGSNAFGGVINIITKKQKKDGIEANARLQYGSYNTQKYMASLGYKKKKFNVFTSFNHDRTDGHRDSADFKITNGYVKTGYQFNKHLKIFADFSLAGYETADPGPVNGVAGDRIDILRGKTAISFENNHERLEGALKMYYNFGEHRISDGWVSNDHMAGAMLYQGMKLLPGNTITLGLDHMKYGGKGSPISTVLRDDEGNVIMPPRFELSPYNNTLMNMSNTAVYTSVQQILFRDLVLNAGLRYEMNTTYGNEWIPQTGLSWHLSSGTTLKGSVSKGYRPPSIRELYLFPPANEILYPERMVNYEVGWTQHWMKGKMNTELVGFISDGKNIIVMVPPFPPPPPQYKNTGSFNNKGVEFSCNYRPADGLKLHANYTYINMVKPLPATPEHNLFLSGNYRYQKLKFTLKLQNIFNLYNETGQGVEVIEDSYHIMGLRVGYQATKFMNVYVYANNLFNQQYQINHGYPMPGTTVFAGLNLKLVKD
ncbi:MAG: TonB-dependent receptor [Bacteroidales bacterium]|nr:TonB-dependent receptor [Bacteroidales bacterium]